MRERKPGGNPVIVCILIHNGWKSWHRKIKKLVARRSLKSL